MHARWRYDWSMMRNEDGTCRRREQVQRGRIRVRLELGRDESKSEVQSGIRKSKLEVRTWKTWEMRKEERGEKVEKLRLFIPLGGDSGIPQDHSPSRKQANQTKGQSLRINFYIQERPIMRKVTARSLIPNCLDEFLPLLWTFFLTHTWSPPFDSTFALGAAHLLLNISASCLSSSIYTHLPRLLNYPPLHAYA